MTKYKILVFTLFDKNSHVGCSYEELSKITIPSYQNYCKIHNYDFKFLCIEPPVGRLIGWNRYKFFLDNMDKYTHQLYVECDSMLMNQTIRLENLIDDNYDVIVAKTPRNDTIELNTGTTLVKSSQWSKDFFTKLYNNEEYKNHQMVDQALINHEVNSSEEVKKHFKIVNLRYFNSQMHEWFPNDNFQPGDFICHSAGSSNDYRMKLFNYLKDNIVKIPDYKIPFKPFLNIGD